MRIIFTCQSFPIASRELQSAFACPPPELLGEGIGLADLAGTYDQISEAFARTPVVFTRHIFPAQIVLPDGANPLDALDDIAQRLDPERSYSVQARSLEGSASTRALSTALQERGFRLDIRRPEQAVSLLSALGRLYIGVSETTLNLSDWNGGMMHFSSSGLISRAECKLLEALAVFSIDTGNMKTALDLGAAPGGWSNALAARGLNVTAVDPAALDARVAPLVTYAQTTAQAFLQTDDGVYDIIVNDMKADALSALELLYRFRERLSPGGIVLTTLKLPKQGGARVASACLSSIRESAQLLGARQLFHNRSEITAVFR